MLPLYDENRSSRRPYVTWALMFLNMIAFLWQFSTGFNAEGFYRYGAIPLFIVNWQRLHTLFTSMFMHSDLFHIGGNMLYLYIFGDNIEDVFGHIKFLLFYLVSGVVGGILHSWFTSITGDLEMMAIPAVGASGAISGVLGAYLVIYPQARIVTLLLLRYVPRVVRIPSFYYLGFWFIMQILYGLLNPLSGVAFWAHIGGFTAGVMAGLAFKGRTGRSYAQYY